MSYRWVVSVCSLLMLGLSVSAKADSMARSQQEPVAKVPSLTLSTAVTVSQSDAKLEELERVAAEEVNAERVKAGLKPLAYSSELADVARGHSQEMQERKYFGHNSPTVGLKTALDRYRSAFHEAPPVVAENLYGAWGGGQKQLAESDMRHAHVALMHSPTHRANILFANLSHIGVGIVTNAAGDVWLTQMFIFAKPSSSVSPSASRQAKAGAQAAG